MRTNDRLATSGTYGATLDAAGWIVVFGSAESLDYRFQYASVARILPYGSRDLTFGGGDGFLLLDSTFAAMTADPVADWLYLARAVEEPGDRAAWLVARLTPDGVIDGSFGDAGAARLEFADWFGDPTDMLIDSRGRIVILGSVYPFSGTGGAFLFGRMRPDGSPDPEFGNGAGITVVPISDAGGFVSPLRSQPDRKLLAAAQDAETGFDPQGVRLTESGELDATFGEAGRVRIDFPDELYPYGLAVQAEDGKVLLYGDGQGHLGESYYSFVGAARWDSDGVLDTGFAQQGRLLQAIGQGPSVASHLLTERGTVLVGAASPTYESERDLMLVRLRPD